MPIAVFYLFGKRTYLDRNYSVFGQVVKGMEYVEQIKKGDGQNGSVQDPDKIISISFIK